MGSAGLAEIGANESAKGKIASSTRRRIVGRACRTSLQTSIPLCCETNATHRHAGEAIEQRQYGLPDGAADILEIDINSVRTSFNQPCLKVTRSVIDCRIEAERVRQVSALVRSSGDTDGPFAPAVMASCPDQRTDGAACGSHSNGLTGRGLADERKPGPSRESRHSEYAQSSRNWRQYSIELAQPHAVQRRVGSPASR